MCVLVVLKRLRIRLANPTWPAGYADRVATGFSYPLNKPTTLPIRHSLLNRPSHPASRFLSGSFDFVSVCRNRHGISFPSWQKHGEFEHFEGRLSRLWRLGQSLAEPDWVPFDFRCLPKTAPTAQFSTTMFYLGINRVHVRKSAKPFLGLAIATNSPMPNETMDIMSARNTPAIAPGRVARS